MSKHYCIVIINEELDNVFTFESLNEALAFYKGIEHKKWIFGNIRGYIGSDVLKEFEKDDEMLKKIKAIIGDEEYNRL